MQRVQVSLLAGEVRETEHFEPYGFTSSPLPGAEGVTVFPSAGRDHSITIVMADRRYRFTENAAGEVTLYHHEGHRVTLRNGGKVEVEAVDLEATLSGAAKITADGEVEVESTGGDVTVKAIAGTVGVEAQTVEVEATGDVQVTAIGNLIATAATALLTVTGTATITGVGAITIAGSGPVTITGSAVTIAGNVMIDGYSFLNHRHSNGTGGDGNTGTVVA